MITKPKIFLVDDNSHTLQQMIETGYVTECTLQHFLAQYPDLLPGDQINPEAPRRWLLVAREMGVPGEMDQSDRWSLDHLFLDQDGIPTFVECKRSTDTRIRREVVAQMLDYAANGIEYWGANRLREEAAKTCGESLTSKLQDLLNTVDGDEVDQFWEKVEHNLRTGNVRLIFVADSLPRELRRLIEFLNEQMPAVEVLGVEIKQFVGEGQKALVPRVIGATETAQINKATGGPSSSNTRQTRFYSQCSPDTAAFFQKMVSLAAPKGHRVYWGDVGFSIGVHLPNQQYVGGQYAGFAYGYPKYGNWPAERFEFYFAQLPLTDEQAQKLRAHLMAFGIFTPAGEKTLRILLDETTLPKMDEIYDFIQKAIAEIQTAYIASNASATV